MPTLQTLLLFSAAVLGLLLAPGPNMVFLISHGVALGPRGGIAVAGGILLADLVLTVLTAAGVAAAIAAWPPSFDVLRYAGAAYLVWLALQTLRRRGDTRSPTLRATLPSVFRMAALNSLLNPKALLFFLVFLPQFVRPESGSVAGQLMVLGMVLSALAFVFHSLLGAFSGRAGQWAGGRHVPVRLLDALQAGVFLALAIHVLVLERPLPA